MDFTFPSSTVIDLKIRELRPEDYPAIYRIAEVTWNKTFKSILTSEQIHAGITSSYTAEALNTSLAEGQDFIVLTESSHLIAFAAYQKTDKYLAPVSPQQPVPSSLQLTKLYCLPEFQGKGYGKQLLQKVEDYARGEKLESLHVLVNRQNEKACEFYKQQGFENIAEINEEYGGFLREDYVFFKRLK